MLKMFRKTRKLYAVLITVMLLLPVQQSFSQAFSRISSFRTAESSTMAMEHCNKSVGTIIDDSSLSSITQHENCCNDNVCKSTSSCSFSISFLALFSNQELLNSFEPQRHPVAVERHEIRVLPSKLFRPPRIV